jgi:hypothetical protein
MEISAIRALIGEDRYDGKMGGKERLAVYLAEGVSWWVASELRRMTKKAVSLLKGISTTSKYTYTTGDGSTITLNMGRDILRWETVAKQAKKSPNREEKRKWLRALHEVLVKELQAVVADADADGVFKGRCRALLAKIARPSLTPQERYAVYKAEGVSWWVGSELRRTNNWWLLRGIPKTYTYRTGDGSTTTLNMGQDIHMWGQAAKQPKKSRKRKQKRKWVRALHKVLVKELQAVVAAADADDVFKSRCRALLARIPDPHWGNA